MNSLSPNLAIHPDTLQFNSNTWLASDLHLSEHTPQTNARFCDWLLQAQQQSQGICLVGDIFDAWLGDDCLDYPIAWLHPVLEHLQKAGRQVPLYIGKGNRDFLVGIRLAQHINATLLPEIAIVQIEQQRFVLCHGDELCTDDVSYQQFRLQVRDPKWQASMLALSLPERIAIAKNLRTESEQAKQDKSMQIMDVNQQAVQALLDVAQVNTLIHGHTHRPGQHKYSHNGQDYQRWVLPDWHGQHGGWLALASSKWVLHQF